MNNIKIISAGAGSGKTYRLTQEMVALLQPGSPEKVRATGIIATTFTNKAAAELQERVRLKLLESGLPKEADEISNALIGTVHGLGVKLLKRFAFEAGVSPQVDIIAEEDQQIMFNQSLSTVLSLDLVKEMELLANRLGLNKRERYDWRKDVLTVTEKARGNNFSKETLEKSKEKSLEELLAFFPDLSSVTAETFDQNLLQILGDSLQVLERDGDSTKTTQRAISNLRGIYLKLKNRGDLNWHDWVKITKIKIGVKSKALVEELVEYAHTHTSHPRFQADIKTFISQVFDIASKAIEEYQSYKKRRGLIDYTDMEVAVLNLLEHPEVRTVLEEEIDLLMVDEFQDTNPIQLEIFIKLSKLAGRAIWVGDPKQSIYAFRGAEPELMQAVIDAVGGVKAADIQAYSWRSREDIVNTVNAIFCPAFPDLPNEQVRLIPKRTKEDNPDDANFKAEPIELETALRQWQFRDDEDKKTPPGRPWMENCIAASLKKMLEDGIYILPKDEKEARKANPGDIAILCRSNAVCQEVAVALNRAGIKAAISGPGLLLTAEVKVVLACLKYILHRSDTLSVAEVQLLAGNRPVEDIVDERLAYLDDIENGRPRAAWASENPLVKRLGELRREVAELSGAETLNLVIEELELRKIITAWGNVERRMDNVDALRSLALKYEATCNRLHTAASLGGLLLWLNELAANQNDQQGSGEGPDAVNVLTYHKSKGLEWPILICHGLEGNLRDKLWGITIVQEQKEIDLDNPLANRYLRYWINPYADQNRGTELQARLDESQIKVEATNKSKAEEVRLLYVGLTRARDYLVFPIRKTSPKWLNRVCNDDAGQPDLLRPDLLVSPWEWEGAAIPMETTNYVYPKNFTRTPIKPEKLSFLSERKGEIPHTSLSLDLGSNKKKTTIRVLNAVAYGKTLDLDKKADPELCAKALELMLHAAYNREQEFDREEIAANILLDLGLSNQINPSAIVAASHSFYNYFKQAYTIKNLQVQYPVQKILNRQYFEGFVDLLIESDKGLILVFNSDFAGNAAQEKKHLLELEFKILHLKQCFSNIRAIYIHFLLQGRLKQVSLQASQQQIGLAF